MLMPAFVEDIKREIQRRMDLQEERGGISSSIKKGIDFFKRENLTNEDATKGLELALQYLTRINEIDDEIKNIDIIIATKLESFLSDSVIKVNLKRMSNDAGDIIDSKDIILTPFKSSESLYVELVPDDIWFLKIIKKALAVKNVEFVDKRQYYQK